MPRQQYWRLLLTVRAMLTVPPAGQKHKHNACRADIGGCVNGYTYISKVKNVCRGSVEECFQTHASSFGQTVDVDEFFCPDPQCMTETFENQSADAAMTFHAWLQNEKAAAKCFNMF
ncbi:TPA: hypothetical protein ACH3X1_008546 [Trebouxia sp. C0004]